MAEINAKVMAMVEDELKKNPDATTDELIEKAKKVDKGVAKLSNRQFNARYPLQVKRRRANGSKSRRRPSRRRRRKGDVDRTAVRGILLDFAREIAGAESKTAVLDVIGNVDSYVDRLAKANGR